MTKDHPICKRQGYCCRYILDGELKTCKHLQKLPSGKTLCRVFSTRIGKVIDKSKKTGRVVLCIWRSESPFNQKTCDFNVPGKPMFNDYVDKEMKKKDGREI